MPVPVPVLAPPAPVLVPFTLYWHLKFRCRFGLHYKLEPQVPVLVPVSVLKLLVLVTVILAHVKCQC